MPDSVQPYGQQPTRLLDPQDFSGKNTGVDCHFLLQGIFPTQGSNPGLPHHRQLLYRLSQNAGLEETQAGIKIAGRNINNLRYADDTTLMAESEDELKSLLMKVKVDSEKVGLKLNIQKMKIVASGPIISWEIDGETVETVADFILGGSIITADGDCSHEIKRRSLLGRKVRTNLDSIFKSRDITLPTKVHLAKAFPVVMYGCESWTVKKAEH